MAAPVSIGLRVNGEARVVTVDPDRKLLDVLRNELRLTGAKYGCGEGQCGACTVLIDGKAVRACLRNVGRTKNQEITTIEGLGGNDGLHPLQRAFVDEGAMQCGYCTPGMILAAAALLKAAPSPTEDAILSGMRGNICRCGTYPRIVKAITRASQAMRGQ